MTDEKGLKLSCGKVEKTDGLNMGTGNRDVNFKKILLYKNDKGN